MIKDGFMTELEVDDWPGTVRWYEETLGIRVIKRDEPNSFALLAAGSSRLALKQSKTPRSGQAHIRLAFLVPNLDAERARLIALGVAVSEPVEKTDEDYREVRLVDPEGLPITLFAWTEPPSRARLRLRLKKTFL